MGTKSTYQPVVFEDSRGNIISNDPVYLAQQTLRAAGVAIDESPAGEDEDQTSDANEALAEDYKSFDAKALKAIAKERGIDIKGISTVGELRAALIAADESNEDDDAEGDDESSEDDSTEE